MDNNPIPTPIKWSSERRSVADLIPAEYNPRTATEKDRQDLSSSLARFSLADPIIINVNNRVIGGHFRLSILKEQGITDVDVRVPDRELTLQEEQELNLRLNKNLGQWDDSLLANLDEDLLKIAGFGSDEIDRIYNINLNKEDNREVPIPEVATTRRGDVWQMGEHRLMCGDSANRDDVNRLLDGRMVDIIVTDPPYGVSIGDKNKMLNSFQRSGRSGRCLENIENDTLSPDKLYTLLLSVFKHACLVLADHGSVYVTAPQGGELGLMMMQMMKDAGLPVRHVLNWVKNSPTFSLGRLDYDYQHEPILFTWKKTHKRIRGGAHRTSCWFIDKPRKCGDHPTMKPIALVENALLNSSERGDTLFDPFCGSGTAVLAAENTNRVCYGMEISPHYCDVIVRAYEKQTGLTAIRLNLSQPTGDPNA